MKDGILKVVKDFIGEHATGKAPLLLGFSGGPDSLALLYLLLECRRFYPLDLRLAHVDHGWRNESRQQAEELKNLAAKLNLPFYLETLAPFEMHNNLEDRAREARLLFFSTLYQELGCQGLLLAHHADDSAETVLKRALEGSGILALGGLRASSILKGMRVLRPLLKVRKKELLRWLKERNHEGIDDPTNYDPRYLRSRMRTHIFPGLNEAFGKEVAMNLVYLGETCQELKDYLYRRTACFLEVVQRTQDTVAIDLNPFFPMEKLEFLALCKQLFEPQGAVFSRVILENAYLALKKRQSKRLFLCKDWELSVERGKIELKNLHKN